MRRKPRSLKSWRWWGFTSTDGVVGTEAISTPPGRSIATSPARKRVGILEVLERLERDDRIEAPGIAERERVGDPELDARAAIASSRVVDGGVAAIDAEHGAHARAVVREQPRPVPDAAGDIEHAAGREAARCELVAFEMELQGRTAGDVARLERIRNEALEAVRRERHRGKPIKRGSQAGSASGRSPRAASRTGERSPQDLPKPAQQPKQQQRERPETVSQLRASLGRGYLIFYPVSGRPAGKGVTPGRIFFRLLEQGVATPTAARPGSASALETRNRAPDLDRSGA